MELNSSVVETFSTDRGLPVLKFVEQDSTNGILGIIGALTSSSKLFRILEDSCLSLNIPRFPASSEIQLRTTTIFEHLSNVSDLRFTFETFASNACNI